MIAMGKMPAKEEPVVVIQQPEQPAQSVKNETAIVMAAEKKEEAVVQTEIKQPVKIAAAPQPIFPEGEFKINETRVLYARKGTSFLAIAQQYNIPLARVFEFNDMAEMETVNKDQLIYLQRKRKTGNNEFHVIQPGETLYDIAQQEAIRIETLFEYNLLKPDMKPAIGETLSLRAKAAAAPRLALKEDYSLYAVNKSSAMNNHVEMSSKPAVIQNQLTGVISCTVQPKETIYAISKKYNVKIDDIVYYV